MSNPTKDDKPTVSQLIGCIEGVLTLMVTLPIWYVLLFGLLIRTDAPAHMWVMYWVYVPVCVLVAIVSKLRKVIE